LASKLREAREYLGLSQQFVEERTGIPRVAISAIENGKRRVEALELERLARFYGQPVSSFLEEAYEEDESLKALGREFVGLSQADHQEVLRFARFLRAHGDKSSNRGQTTSDEV
jgi:transcriptional regulator with XRE-family HTH domain